MPGKGYYQFPHFVDSARANALHVLIRTLIWSLTAIILLAINIQEKIQRTEFIACYVTLTAGATIHLLLFVFARERITIGASLTSSFLDCVIVAALIYFTGLEPFFLSLFFPNVVLAGIFLGRMWALFIASFSTVLLACISILFSYASNPETPLHIPLVSMQTIGRAALQQKTFLPYIFFFAFCVHAAGFLAGLVSEEVSRMALISSRMLQSIKDGIIFYGKDGATVFSNLVGNGLAVTFKTEIENILRKMSSDSIGEIVESCEASDRHYTIAASKVKEKNNLVGTLVIIRDTTLEMKEKEMSLLKERFEAAKFVTGKVAHEVRNPLSAIKISAEQLAIDRSTEKDKRLLSLIVSEINRLDRIVEEYQKWSSSGVLNFTRVSVKKLAEDVSELFVHRFKDEGVTFVLNAQDAVCWGDADRLKQVLINLIDNALDAVSKGGHIQVDIVDIGTGARIVVSDNGHGIPSDIRAKIFQPFFTTRPDGSGLGLSIVAEIVSLHKGYISVDSSEKGTRFIVEIPSR